MVTTMRINNHGSNQGYNIGSFTKKIISPVRQGDYFLCEHDNYISKTWSSYHKLKPIRENKN